MLIRSFNSFLCIHGQDFSLVCFHFLVFRVDERYENLKDLAAQRRKKLLEALAQFKLNREAYIVDTWITERVRISTVFFHPRQSWYCG